MIYSLKRMSKYHKRDSNLRILKLFVLSPLIDICKEKNVFLKLKRIFLCINDYLKILSHLKCIH